MKRQLRSFFFPCFKISNPVFDSFYICGRKECLEDIEVYIFQTKTIRCFISINTKKFYINFIYIMKTSLFLTLIFVVISVIIGIKEGLSNNKKKKRKIHVLII